MLYLFVFAAEGLLDKTTAFAANHHHFNFSLFFPHCVCVCPSVCTCCVCSSHSRPGFVLLGRHRANVASLCPPLLCPPCCRPIGAGKCAVGVLPLVSTLIAAPPMGRAAAGAHTGGSRPRQSEPPADLRRRGRRPAEVVHVQTRGPPEQGMIPTALFAAFNRTG